MVIKAYGDKNLPKIVLLHPMLADGECMLHLTAGMTGRYCFIAPDLSGQGSDEGEFENPEKEARILTEYLKNNGFDTIELIAGASLGGVVGMLMLADADIRYKTAVFEGVPMYENARFICLIMKFVLLKMHRKAMGMPLDKVSSRDMNCRQNKVVLKHYPYLHIKVRKGYGHCVYPAVHDKEYGRLLEMYMNTKCV